MDTEETKSDKKTFGKWKILILVALAFFVLNVAAGVLMAWYVRSSFFCMVSKNDIARFYEPIFSTPISKTNLLSAHDYSHFGECFDFEATSDEPFQLASKFTPAPVPSLKDVTLGMPSQPIKGAFPWIAEHFTFDYGGLAGMESVDIYFDSGRKHCLVKGKEHWFHDTAR